MMYWNTWNDFFVMGGYALYVWGSIIVVAGFMLAEIFLVRLRRKTVLRQIALAATPRPRKST